MTLDDLTNDENADVVKFLFALSDDEFLMANRLTRWVGSGPTLEEDNAISSLVQDELGHARLWLEVIAESDERSVSALAQTRPPEERFHSILVEPDHEHFADAVVRNLLYDYAERLLVESIRDGDIDELSSRAEVVLKEEHFHREHAERWLKILSATAEGREKLRDGFETNLPRARDYFEFEESLESSLLDLGVITDEFDDLRGAWAGDLTDTIEAATDAIDVKRAREVLSEAPDMNGRNNQHTEILEQILDNVYPTKDELYPDHTDLEGDIRYEEKIGL